MSERARRVRRQLEAHQPADAAERRALRDTLALLDGAADPFSRAQLPGHLTASAIVLDATAEHVLIVWHDGLGRWLQPGGHFEPGDVDAADAARRETREETGVETGAWDARLVHVDVHDIPARGDEPPHRHHDLRFAFVASHAASRGLAEGATSGWMRLDVLDTVLTDDSLRRALARATDAVGPRAGQHDAGTPR